MQIVLLFACYTDLALWCMALILGRLYLCPEELSGEGFQCINGEATPYLLILNLVWPGAAFFSIFGGILVHSSELKTNQIRMYSSWSRLFVVPILLLTIFYFYFNIQGLSVTETAQQKGMLLIDIIGLMALSRALQIVITEQYIALVDRIRLTLGWDGLMTAIFMTKDSVRDVQADNNLFAEF